MLYALALDPLSLQTPPHCIRKTRTLAPLLDDLALGNAVDDDTSSLDLHSARREAQILPSIVGALRGEATYHLVPFGCLILDEYAGVGDGGRELGDYLHEALAARLLARLQAMINEVGGEQLL